MLLGNPLSLKHVQNSSIYPFWSMHKFVITFLVATVAAVHQCRKKKPTHLFPNPHNLVPTLSVTSSTTPLSLHTLSTLPTAPATTHRASLSSRTNLHTSAHQTGK